MRNTPKELRCICCNDQPNAVINPLTKKEKKRKKERTLVSKVRLRYKFEHSIQLFYKAFAYKNLMYNMKKIFSILCLFQRSFYFWFLFETHHKLLNKH